MARYPACSCTCRSWTQGAVSVMASMLETATAADDKLDGTAVHLTRLATPTYRLEGIVHVSWIASATSINKVNQQSQSAKSTVKAFTKKQCCTGCASQCNIAIAMQLLPMSSSPVLKLTICITAIVPAISTPSTTSNTLCHCCYWNDCASPGSSQCCLQYQ